MHTDNTSDHPPQPRRTLGFLASAIDGGRRPAPDVMGYLADRGIRRGELSAIGQHVRAEWPNVRCVRCGVMGETPYFSIHIEPFSKAAQREHWPLTDWIMMLLGGTSDCRFFLLPASEDQPFGSEITIHPTPPAKERDAA